MDYRQFFLANVFSPDQESIMINGETSGGLSGRYNISTILQGTEYFPVYCDIYVEVPQQNLPINPVYMIVFDIMYILERLSSFELINTDFPTSMIDFLLNKAEHPMFIPNITVDGDDILRTTVTTDLETQKIMIHISRPDGNPFILSPLHILINCGLLTIQPHSFNILQRV
jgi:hypothetical protein